MYRALLLATDTRNVCLQLGKLWVLQWPPFYRASQIHRLKPSPECDGFWRWGLWNKCLYKKCSKELFSVFPTYENTVRRYHPWARKWALTRHSFASASVLDFQPLEQWETCVVLNCPVCAMLFCYSIPNKLRQRPLSNSASPPHVCISLAFMLGC
jgi:hypothetical protein